ncbi:hypothetical protein [Candidatus Methylacidithermus pantelleriae]|uniref:hypothetical protein n=1 Tax=Candidatus Methylacidithermus pantelleriae TaxID=2744239 RepID=UPI001BD210D1|nr:hypothetical protein [Candidatus Methylacidithermus pantelleriae]
MRDLHEEARFHCVSDFAARALPRNPAKEEETRSDRMTKLPLFRYQMELRVNIEQGALLATYAALYGWVERSFFCQMRAHGSLKNRKRSFLLRFGWTRSRVPCPRVWSSKKRSL